MKNLKSQGKGVPKGEKPLIRAFRLCSTTYFLTYKGISDSGQRITKESLADFLLNQNPRDRAVRPVKYLVCEQMYDDGTPHFHAILIYPRRKQVLSQDHYDYLGIHPNIQTMRNMKAALNYVYKQDAHPVTNMDIAQQRRVARAKDNSSVFQLLYQQMIKDPLNFDVYRYCETHDLTRHIYRTNYSKAVRLLRQAQRVRANNCLMERPGFKPITRALIQQRLTPFELQVFDSWPGYQTIVNYLNIMTLQRGRRQQKSMNLLITGPPNTGKSALVWQRNPLPGRTSIADHCSVYPMGMRDWFPEYLSDVYHCIYWNQAKLTSYSMDIILQILDGSPVNLPAKGTSHKKVDNPLVILTSNLTLSQMIHAKFGHNRHYQQMARANLAVRIQNVVLPPGRDLFLLQRLLVAPD